MATGTVKWFNTAKGSGFIIPDEGGEDVFAPDSEIVASGIKALSERQKVEFTVKYGPKGRTAYAIKPL